MERYELPIREVANDWFRVHQTRRGPVYFGTSGNNRFDAPDAEFGVMYVGLDAHCAIVETVGFSAFGRLIAASSVAHLSLARIETARLLRLVDLTADGLIRLGADARLTTGQYTVSQRWSRAIWHHPERPDGVLYRSRHDPSRLSAALFDRVADSVVLTRSDAFTSASMQQSLRDVFATYGYVVVED
ncbi:MAG TPA: RES family NAD+ phosphorylase [Thermomicrobiales bacterium]|nr:RES family NAD+ phosphorylase [Thermomicrobiales bacterium]